MKQATFSIIKKNNEYFEVSTKNKLCTYLSRYFVKPLALYNVMGEIASAVNNDLKMAVLFEVV